MCSWKRNHRNCSFWKDADMTMGHVERVNDVREGAADGEGRVRGAHLPRRIIWFCVGLAINSFGIALITRAGLGTSQISSVPYVLSLAFPQVSFSAMTFLVNLVFVAVQVVLLGRDFFPFQLLQIPANLAFSALLGLSMSALDWLAPASLVAQLALSALGCCILGFGVAVECAPALVFVPGEGIVHAISQVTGARLGTVKVIFDVTLVAVASALSLVFFHGLRGVGVGTAITMFLTGTVVNLSNEHIPLLRHIRSLTAK